MICRKDHRRPRGWRSTIAVLATFLVVVVATSPRAGDTPLNIPLPTLGGTQFWSDVELRAGWRVQENLLTGHFRLLDPSDVRRAWGTYAEARAVLPAVVPNQEHTVLLIPGILRARGTFGRLEAALARAGYDAHAISYASSRASILDHADRLEMLLNRLPGTRKISFVTHSMGGLVVRELLARESGWRERIELGRVVMIAPPNQGSAIARALRNFAPYRWVFGRAGQQLTPAVASQLPKLTAEFGIIAGGRRDGAGYNPCLAGDDDGTVAVPETRLSGARDHILVRSPHATISGHPATISGVRNFLKFGRFSGPASS